jgi:hypothetical protein
MTLAMVRFHGRARNLGDAMDRRRRTPAYLFCTSSTAKIFVVARNFL